MFISCTHRCTKIKSCTFICFESRPLRHPVHRHLVQAFPYAFFNVSTCSWARATEVCTRGPKQMYRCPNFWYYGLVCYARVHLIIGSLLFFTFGAQQPQKKQTICTARFSALVSDRCVLLFFFCIFAFFKTFFVCFDLYMHNPFVPLNMILKCQLLHAHCLWSTKPRRLGHTPKRFYLSFRLGFQWSTCDGS